MDGVTLEFDDSATDYVVEKARERKTGARALRAVIENFMLPIMFQIPDNKNVKKYTITRELIDRIMADENIEFTEISKSA